jgi:hypothetical protein
MGWRLLVSGSVGGIDVTSMTYFNMTESAAKAPTLTPTCPVIGKGGIFTVGAGCNTGVFTEEYVQIEGVTFGCLTFDAALSILCTGFNYATLLVQDIPVFGNISLDLSVTFTLDNKAIGKCFTMTVLDTQCLTLEFNPTFAVLELYGFSFEAVFGGVTISDVTELSASSKLMSGSTTYSYLNGPAVGFLTPWTGVIGCSPDPLCDPCADSICSIYAAIGHGYWVFNCLPLERYQLWEKLSIEVDADACCGGAFGVSIDTYFGEYEELSWVAYAVQNETLADAASITDTYYLYGTDANKAYWELSTYKHTAVDAEDCPNDEAVLFDKGYAGSTDQTTLFNWAKTTIDLSVGVGTNVELTFGFNIGAFGFDSFDFGFTWSF